MLPHTAKNTPAACHQHQIKGHNSHFHYGRSFEILGTEFLTHQGHKLHELMSVFWFIYSDSDHISGANWKIM